MTGSDESDSGEQSTAQAELLQRAQNDIELMRASIPQLTTGSADAWQQLRYRSLHIATRAGTQELGVLRACSRELAALAEENLEGRALDSQFLLAAISAIEMVALEVARLTRERG